MGFPNLSLALWLCVCLFSPQIVGGYATFLYEVGLLDEKQRKYFQEQCNESLAHIKEGEWLQAFEVSSGPPGPGAMRTI